MNPTIPHVPDALEDFECAMQWAMLPLDDACIRCTRDDYMPEDHNHNGGVMFTNKNCQETFDQLRQWWGPDGELSLLAPVTNQAAAGFDYNTAALCGGVGLVAGYALMKVFRGRKADDQFTRC